MPIASNISIVKIEEDLAIDQSTLKRLWNKEVQAESRAIERSSWAETDMLTVCNFAFNDQEAWLQFGATSLLLRVDSKNVTWQLTAESPSQTSRLESCLLVNGGTHDGWTCDRSLVLSRFLGRRIRYTRYLHEVIVISHPELEVAFRSLRLAGTDQYILFYPHKL
jgi:hypothetical protein